MTRWKALDQIYQSDAMLEAYLEHNVDLEKTLNNNAFVARIGVDTAEDEPLNYPRN